jgi:isocitrate lyase
MGGKVLVPTSQFIRTLNAARLASDILGTHTVIIARTDAQAANMLTTDSDKRDHKFLTGERTSEGFYKVHNGIHVAIDRAISYAPYADLLWCETDTPDYKEAKYFAESVHSQYPGKPLAYNCSPSFNWADYLSASEIESFQKDLGKLGYRYQFITLAGFHNMNHAMFKMARGYRKRGMSAFVEIQQDEMKQENHGFTARKHQREVGASYFDKVTTLVSGGDSSTTALKGSTEEEQFEYTQDLETFKSSFHSP